MSKMSNIHVMAQEMVTKLADIEANVRTNDEFKDWSWKHFWLKEVSGYNKLGMIRFMLGINNRNEQLLVIEAVQNIISEEL